MINKLIHYTFEAIILAMFAMLIYITYNVTIHANTEIRIAGDQVFCEALEMIK